MALVQSFGRRRRLPFTLLLVGVWIALAVFAPLRDNTRQDAALGETPGRSGLRRLLQSLASENASAEDGTSATNTFVTAEDGWGSGSGSGFYEDGDDDGDDEPPRNCTAPALHEFPKDLISAHDRRRGAAVLHALVAAYLFIFLAVVCDDYFVPSIKILCAKMKLPEDVAGATFMAAATSSPELFVNCVGTFITEGDIGVGTVVGSGVFNILVVPACCGLFGGKVVRLNPWPVTRDSAAYTATILLLIAALSDGRVEWYEAAAFVVLYVAYVAALCVGPRLRGCLRRVCLGDPEGGGAVQGNGDVVPCTRDGLDGEPLGSDAELSERSPLLARGDAEKARGWHYQFTTGNSTLVIHDLEEYQDEGVCSPPSGATFRAFLWWLLLRPIKALLYMTVPDCRRHRWRSVYLLTFVVCVLWIAGASYIVSWMITVVGDTLQIPDSVLGLTLLAAGTSLPEAVSSVIVTNQGYGAMGISNSIGSNTFNILLCLGLPWLLKSLFFPLVPGQSWVPINSGGLLYNTISLLTTLFLLYFSFAYNSFKLDRTLGAITLIMYLAFIAIAFAVELNAFGVVNLPTCPH